MEEWSKRSLAQSDHQLELTFELYSSRKKRLQTYFYLNPSGQSKADWNKNYLSQLAATRGFEVRSDDGPVSSQVNSLIKEMYLVFYAVPLNGPEDRALRGLSRQTALFTSRLKVDFMDKLNIEYVVVLGTAALQIACEQKLQNAKHIEQKQAARHNHLFDWEC